MEIQHHSLQHHNEAGMDPNTHSTLKVLNFKMLWWQLFLSCLSLSLPILRVLPITLSLTDCGTAASQSHNGPT